MSKALSIQDVQSIDKKTQIKTWIGAMASRILRKRANELYLKPVHNSPRFLDRMIVEYFQQDSIQKNELEFLERLHKAFWEGDGGEVFADNCDHRFHDWFLERQQTDFRLLRKIWHEQRVSRLVEFGCNSGLLTNYMTQHLGGVYEATGIDINGRRIQKNKEMARDFDSRIEFVHADSYEWLLENGQNGSLFVSNGGVLEYFRRERLDEMVSFIAENCSPAIFFSVEPIAEDHDLARNTNSIPFGNEMSFSHNYRDLFESNGFTIRHQREMRLDDWKFQVTIAVVN